MSFWVADDSAFQKEPPRSPGVLLPRMALKRCVLVAGRRRVGAASRCARQSVGPRSTSRKGGSRSGSVPIGQPFRAYVATRGRRPVGRSKGASFVAGRRKPRFACSGNPGGERWPREGHGRRNTRSGGPEPERRGRETSARADDPGPQARHGRALVTLFGGVHTAGARAAPPTTETEKLRGPNAGRVGRARRRCYGAPRP